eukprot:TRINITY_DN13682_c0_g1_i1.p1 TRINITY_DN13682_c0_g1~~TRINITY_DN13682_c0_g1_i1.p1  ORF type:complete len:158 (+),score=32.57 TRINITY_DN13682_c0_g1_i1:185-658(+)
MLHVKEKPEDFAKALRKAFGQQQIQVVAASIEPQVQVQGTVTPGLRPGRQSRAEGPGNKGSIGGVIFQKVSDMPHMMPSWLTVLAIGCALLALVAYAATNWQTEDWPTSAREQWSFRSGPRNGEESAVSLTDRSFSARSSQGASPRTYTRQLEAEVE